MLKLRIREYSPTGVKGRILPVVDNTLEVTTQLNGTPTISFALSKIMSGKMPDDGFVVGVEYGVGNGRYKPLPQHDMFIITNYDWDDTEPTQVVRYSGMSYVIWLMGMTYLHWSEYAVNNERLWTETGHPASPGTIVGGMIHEAKLRGWGSQVSTDFTWDKDSNNVAWTADDKILQKYRLLTPITEVLESLVTGGLCDWTVEGLKLRMFRPDTLGADKSNLVITRSESKPIKTDMSEIFTNLTVVPDEATHWLYLDNPGAPSKYGRLEATMTQSGINNHAEATKLAQPTLLKGRHTTREEAFQYHPNQGQLIPWEDFSIGDKVTVLVAGEKVTRRVIGLVAKTDQGNTSVRVIVGDPITSVSRKILDRVGAASVGGIIGGSGNSFPGSTGPSPLAPENPDNLRVTSNTSEWLDDGSAASTVKLEWEPVTRAIDGSSAIIQEYEVWARRNSEQFTRVTAVINPEATISIWEPGIDRIVRVRALSTNGQWSEFSLDLALTPSVPTSVVPAAPGKPVLVSNVGSFTAAGPVAAVTLTIPVVTLSTDGEPIEVAEYELWDADGPLFRLPASPAKVTIPSDLVRVYRARACSAQGVWGDLSESLSVTGAKPALVVRNPTAPVLTTGAGNAFARWDGTYVSGGTAGAHRVDVEARIGAAAWVVQGTLIGAGQQIIKIGAIGDTVAVRLRAYDQLGRLTGTSTESSIEVVGIPRADLDQDINDFLDELDELAGDAWDAASAAVKNTVTQYAVGSSDTVAPSSGWSTDTPTRTPGSFIWMRSVVTFGDDSTSTTNPVLVTGNDGAEGNPGAPGTPGTPGAPGADGRGIVSTEIRYQAGSSGTTAPTDTWHTTVPTVSAGQYLWTRTTVTYTSGSPSVSYSVGRMGTNGSNGTPGTPGANGQTSYLHVAYANSADGATNFSTDDPSGRAYMGTYTDFTEADSTTPGDYTWALIKGADGSTGPAGKGIASSVINYAQSTSGTTTPTSGWQTTIPTVPEGQYLWTRTRITFTDSAQSDTFTVAKQGAKGDTGAPGTPGTPGTPGAQGVSVSSVQQYYRTTAATASAPAVPTTTTPTGWSTTEPPYAENTALWVTTRVGYSNNTFSYTPVSKVSAFTASVMAGGKLTLATANPTTAQGTGKPAGSLWMVKTGTAFSSMWEWSGTAWANRPLSETIIPQVAIGSGTYGELAGTRLSANSVTASKVAIGDFTDRYPDPELKDGNYSPWAVVDGALEKNGTSSQNGMYWAHTRFAAKPGEKFLVKYSRTNVAGSTGDARLYVQFATDAAGTTFANVPGGHGSPITAPIAGGDVSGIITAPANTVYLRIGYFTEANMPSSVRVRFSVPEIRRMEQGELIVDGAVHARHVTMDEGFADKFWANEGNFGKIKTDMVDPLFGDTLNLGGNAVAINLNSRADDVEVLIEQTQQSADAAQAAADAAAGSADTANQAVETLAAGRVLTAENALGALSDKIDDYENSFLFLSDGLHIRESKTSSAEMVLTSAGARLIADGATASEWNQGQLIVDQIIANGGRIGNHALDATIVGHTIWRSI